MRPSLSPVGELVSEVRRFMAATVSKPHPSRRRRERPLSFWSVGQAGGRPVHPPVRRFVWTRCFSENAIVYALPLQFQGNGMLRSILGANALLDIPAGSPPPAKGDELEAIVTQPFF